jgi:hypothetical protein
VFELTKNERILFVAKTKSASLPGGRKDTLMKKDNVVSIQGRDEPATDPATVLDEIVREGARRMLQAALETEVTEYVERHANLVDIQGHRVVVRNGYLPERDLVTGAGPVNIKQPRVRGTWGQGRLQVLVFITSRAPPFPVSYAFGVRSYAICVYVKFLWFVA